MITLKENFDCCGCQACGDICPRQAITFNADDEGFWYPKVDVKKCIDCGLCEKICPFQKKYPCVKDMPVYAAINPENEVRRRSSSGGIFSMLAEQVVRDGGVVFGATFDEEWMVSHSVAETVDDILLFQGSKYVQSKVSGCYRNVKQYLNTGRKVLFSGTACQIAGLKGFLLKEYENLITIDVVCHGVPSPGIWLEYITKLQSKSDISYIFFRDKRNSWRHYNFTVVFSNGTELSEEHNKNIYMQGFLHDYYLRPSCHHCRVKGKECGSDITLGDFWGIEKIIPELNDDGGVSLILTHTNKGQNLIQGLSMPLYKTTFSQAVLTNTSVVASTPMSKWRACFYERYKRGEGLNAIQEVLAQERPSIIPRFVHRVKRIFKK